CGSVIRDWTSWKSDEMTARRLRPESIEPAVPMITSGTPQFTPKATGPRHGLRPWPAAFTCATASQPRSRIRNPKTSIIGWGLKFWRPWLKTEYIGISRNTWSRAGRQPDTGVTPRSRYRRGWALGL